MPQKRWWGSAFALSPIRFLSSCTPREVVVIFSCLALSTERRSVGPPCRAPGSPVRVAPRSGRGPLALPRVHGSDGPSGHPLAFGPVTRSYLAPGSFSPGPGGLRQFRSHPLLACCRQYPVRLDGGLSQNAAVDAAFAT